MAAAAILPLAASVLAPAAEAALPFLVAKGAELAGEVGGDVANKIAKEALPKIGDVIFKKLFEKPQKKPNVKEFLNDQGLPPSEVEKIQAQEEPVTAYMNPLTARKLTKEDVRQIRIREPAAEELLVPHGIPYEGGPELPLGFEEYPPEIIGLYNEYMQEVMKQNKRTRRSHDGARRKTGKKHTKATNQYFAQKGPIYENSRKYKRY